MPVEVIVNRGNVTYRYMYDYSLEKDMTGYWGPKSTEKYSLRKNDTLNKVSYTYGAYSQLLEKTYHQDENTIITVQNQLTSDSKNIAQSRITSSRDGLMQCDDCVYDSHGNMTRDAKYKGTAGNYEWIYYTYDSKGMYLAEVKQNNITNKMEYDALGNVTKTTDGNGNTVTYTYDKYGNQTGSNDGKYKTRNVYDYAGNNVAYYDENNKGTFYDYNVIGQLLNVKDMATGKILAEYTYDKKNLMVNSATIGNKSKLSIVYNTFDEIYSREITDPNNSNTVLYKEVYERNLNNTDYQEIVTKIGDGSYSTVSRLDLDGYETYSKVNGVETTYTVDMLGNTLTSITDGVTTKMEYDGLGNMLKLTRPKGGVYKYGYDTLGRKISETAPDGGITTFEYDDSNRLIKECAPMGSNSQKSEKKYTYDNNGNVKTESVKTNTVGSSAATYRTTNYNYDAKNNLIKVQNIDNSVNQCYTEYEYDGVGNILKQKAVTGKM